VPKERALALEHSAGRCLACPTEDQTLRLFLAGPLPDAVQSTLFLALSAARRAASQARWVRPGQLHLTLAFLGETEASAVPPLVDALRPVGGRHGPLRLGLEGAGCFGRPRAPNVLFAKLGGEVPALRELAEDVRAVLDTLGVGHPREAEAFFPHLTLARARGRQGDTALSRCQRALRDRALGAFVLERMALVQSELLASGSRYTELADFPLGLVAERTF
jgi:RNA 2',3'-cyclic 3'-phosphodiesterase